MTLEKVILTVVISGLSTVVALKYVDSYLPPPELPCTVTYHLVKKHYSQKHGKYILPPVEVEETWTAAGTGTYSKTGLTCNLTGSQNV